MQISNEALEQITTLAKRQVIQEKDLVKAEKALTEAQEALKHTSEVLLPNVMSEIGLSEIRLDSGEYITVDRKIKSSISEEHFPAARKWLAENELDGIIKHVVSLSFSKGENKRAEQALKTLVEAGYTPQDKESIHYQTLNATVREQLGKGVDVPTDLFGIFEVVKTKVSLK